MAQSDMNPLNFAPTALRPALNIPGEVLDLEPSAQDAFNLSQTKTRPLIRYKPQT